MSGVPENRSLPKKYKDIFSTLHKCYEKKEYSAGLKAADQILEKYPNHGETLAMKGLIVHSKGEKEEGYRLVKLGVKNDIQSSVCWHVFGLLYRADLNNKEASKCYLNALRIDPHNQLILRDLSWLQAQLGDYAGFCETRRKIIVGRPAIRAHWSAYIVANYFAGRYDTAIDIINQYRSNFGVDPKFPYEESEILLFQIRCYEKAGKYAEALAQLKTNEHMIVDKYTSRVKTAEFLVLTGQFLEAVDCWIDLLRENGENYRFHRGLQCAILGLEKEASLKVFAMSRLDLPSNTFNLSEAQRSAVIAVYREPKFSAKANEKILLEMLVGSEFDSALDSFMRRMLREGVPSLFQDIRAFCTVIDPEDSSRRLHVTDPADYRVHPTFRLALRLCDAYLNNLHQNNTLTGAGDAEPPTTVLWTMYLKCSLLELEGNLKDALLLVDECIQHTPTAPDMIAKKARLLKKSGDYAAAAVYMDGCRRIDLQDRYLNNKATKYFLRADMMNEAMETIALFTKHDGDPQQILFELQCNWYEIRAGESYARMNDNARALKKFLATERHFKDYFDDLFDFHQYATRKVLSYTLQFANVMVVLDDFTSVRGCIDGDERCLH